MTFNSEIDGGGEPAIEGGLQIRIMHSRLFNTNSGIFISEGKALLVDPGIFPDEIRGIFETAERNHYTVQAILLTHSHWDHILSPEKLPGIPLIAQANFNKTAVADKEIILKEIAAWEYEYSIVRARPFRLPVPDLVFEKDLEFFLGEVSLRFLAAAGHSADQCVVHHPASGSLWAADMLSDLEIPLVSSSLADYRHSLAMIAGLEIRSLIPGHGHPTDDPEEIRARLAGDQAYLDNLAEKVERAARYGKSMEETVNDCQAIPYRQGAENASAHKMNVESAYLEAGGDPGGRMEAGWARSG